MRPHTDSTRRARRRRHAALTVAAIAAAACALGGGAASAAQPAGWGQGTQLQEFTPPAKAGEGFFGSTVELSANGSTGVVGAYYQDSGTGTAYVYTKRGSAWKRTATLTASDGADGDYFGSDIGISPDGRTIAVGAWDKNDTTGAAYVFTKASGKWTQAAELTADNGIAGDGFGTGVAVSKKGATILVGANGVDDSAGAVYVFTKQGTTWGQVAELQASDGSAYAGLGGPISVTPNGTTAAVGAYLGGASYGGEAYVFSDAGGTWQQTAALTPSDGSGIGYFGNSVAISTNGNTVAVGANGHDANAGEGYVFHNTGGTWQQTGEFTGNDTAGGDEFGISVGMTGNGATVVAGALSHDDGTGAVYVFSRAHGTWVQRNELTAADGAEGDYLGGAVAISQDGSTILGGAWGADGGVGQAYMFGR